MYSVLFIQMNLSSPIKVCIELNSVVVFRHNHKFWFSINKKQIKTKPKKTILFIHKKIVICIICLALTASICFQTTSTWSVWKATIKHMVQWIYSNLVCLIDSTIAGATSHYVRVLSKNKNKKHFGKRTNWREKNLNKWRSQNRTTCGNEKTTKITTTIAAEVDAINRMRRIQLQSQLGNRHYSDTSFKTSLYTTHTRTHTPNVNDESIRNSRQTFVHIHDTDG